jgi:hypothetical protein
MFYASANTDLREKPTGHKTQDWGCGAQEIALLTALRGGVYSWVDMSAAEIKFVN